MGASLVTLGSLLARPGFDNVDSGQADRLLEDASDLVRDFARPHLDGVDADEVPGSVRAVVVNMVRRGLHNPHGVTQESLGDYSYSVQQGSVYLTKREERIVRRAVGLSGVGVIELESPAPITDDRADEVTEW